MGDTRFVQEEQTMSIEIRPQGDADFFALLQGENMPGEVQANGSFSEQQQLQLAVYAANLVQGKFPIAPHGAKWEALTMDEPNRLTLVSYTENQPRWLLVLTTTQPVAIPDTKETQNVH